MLKSQTHGKLVNFDSYPKTVLGDVLQSLRVHLGSGSWEIWLTTEGIAVRPHETDV